MQNTKAMLLYVQKSRVASEVAVFVLENRLSMFTPEMMRFIVFEIMKDLPPVKTLKVMDGKRWTTRVRKLIRQWMFDTVEKTIAIHDALDLVDISKAMRMSNRPTECTRRDVRRTITLLKTRIENGSTLLGIASSNAKYGALPWIILSRKLDDGEYKDTIIASVTTAVSYEVSANL